MQPIYSLRCYCCDTLFVCDIEGIVPTRERYKLQAIGIGPEFAGDCGSDAAAGSQNNGAVSFSK
ncbi:hypothetical protein D3C87_2118030 [compost metagenome]